MSVRAKFRVTSIKTVDWNKDIRVVELSAVSAGDIPENQRFHKFTPSGNVILTIDNPAASDQFVLGQEYYLDFTPSSAQA